MRVEYICRGCGNVWVDKPDFVGCPLCGRGSRADGGDNRWYYSKKVYQ